jgi:hypothetical protein
MTDYNRERGSSIARTHRSAQGEKIYIYITLTYITLVVLAPDGPNNNKQYSSFFGAKNRRGKNPGQTPLKQKQKTSATSHAQDTKQPGMRIADCKQCWIKYPWSQANSDSMSNKRKATPDTKRGGDTHLRHAACNTWESLEWSKSHNTNNVTRKVLI